MTIVLTGGSGFIGHSLAKRLLDEGHTVVVVDRRAPLFTHEHLYFINCDITASALPYNILERTDAVIHLVGASIFQKWTPQIKADILKSRVQSTKRIVESIASAQVRPPVFICASAVGFYGETGTAVVDEQSPKGEGFLADTVAAWEDAAREATQYGVRVVMVRTAPVIGHGGMLSILAQTARFGFLVNVTKKDFWMSWIHEKDIVNAYMFALQTSTLQGAVNAVSPNPILYKDMMSAIAQVLKRKIIGSIPLWIVRMKIGELYDEITKNVKVAPRRLSDKGFVFEYPTIKEALEDIYHHEPRR